jgi:hypothetical protein
MQRRYLFILCSVLFVCGITCNINDGSLERSIIKYYNEHCSSSTNCYLRISDLMDRDWDRMFVFKYVVSPEEVLKALNVQRYDEYIEFDRKIIFMKGEKIIYQEQHWTDPESLVNGEIVFDLSDSERFKVYSKREAIFNVRKVPFDRGCYFELRTQIQGN